MPSLCRAWRVHWIYARWTWTYQPSFRSPFFSLAYVPSHLVPTPRSHCTYLSVVRADLPYASISPCPVEASFSYRLVDRLYNSSTRAIRKKQRKLAFSRSQGRLGLLRLCMLSHVHKRWIARWKYRPTFRSYLRSSCTRGPFPFSSLHNAGIISRHLRDLTCERSLNDTSYRDEGWTPRTCGNKEGKGGPGYAEKRKGPSKRV